MKKHYETPESVVTRVELESPICGGSVKFDTANDKVVINEQDFADVTNNDFSDKPFEVTTTDGN